MPSVKDHTFARGPNTSWPEDIYPLLEALRKDNATLRQDLIDHVAAATIGQSDRTDRHRVILL